MAIIGTRGVEAVGGYTIVRREPLERLEGAFIELVHERTGARHIHIECTDDNNAFAVSFPTVPKDSTGVAHILEHVVLAGSRRFPVRDPFFSMTRRSLATFMNALTSSDSTTYPFSTRNPKDYMNLLLVYLDAAFFPLLEEDSFKQEGIRFEFENPADPKSGLRYKGVVFNEMKGALATPQAAMQRNLGRTLFPGLTYANISGGDPEHIPDLTWDQLRRFHAEHYHPSNAYFYTYGNQPLDRTLAVIEENALSQFEPFAIDTTIANVTRFSKPVASVEPYPAAAGEDNSRKAQALVGWVTVPAVDSFRLLSMRVLSEVLLGNSGSPLRKALIDSKIGSALADGSGFQDDYKETVFGAGLKGIAIDDARKVEEVVLQTLERLAADGVDTAQVDAAIHRLEFEKRERSNAGYPYALKVLFTFIGAYQYGGDPYAAINLDADLEHLERARKEGRFFESLIAAELLDNQHRALLTLAPDPDLEERKRRQELERLAAVERTLPDADRARIVADALRLKNAQEAKQDLAVLPSLELSDIPMQFEDVPSRQIKIGLATVEFFPLPTNGITYIDIRSDFSALPQALKDLLPLFSRVFTQTGAAGQDYVQIAARIAGYTGGVGAAPAVQPLASRDDYLQSFYVSGRALDRNVGPFIDLLTDLTARLTIEPGRLKEVIDESATRLESSISGLGFQFAILRATSKLSSEGAINDGLQGIGMLHEVRRLARLSQGELGEVITRLAAIRTTLFRQDSVHIIVTCEESMIDPIAERLQGLVGALPAGGANGHVERPGPLAAVPEARTTPLPVAFNVRGFKTVRYTHPDAPTLLVLANYLRDTFLHRELREKGGAYGAMAQASTGSGTFYMASYRDPNVTRTYDTFDRAATWLIESEVVEDALKEAILGACGDVDPLESPDIKGRREAGNQLTGFTRQERERFKERLLEVSAADLRRVAAKYLAGGRHVETTVAGPELIEAATRERPGLFELVAPV
jgi:Zn-dependent M16 (insulinase) family peptidase